MKPSQLKIFSLQEKKKLVAQLNKQFGIKSVDGMILMRGNERLFLFQGVFAEKQIRELESTLPIERVGIYFGKEINGEIRLSIEGTQILKNQITKNIFELNEEQLELWMRGNELNLKTEPKGFVVMRYKNDFLGCGKASAEKITNFVPKNRRLKKIVYSLQIMNSEKILLAGKIASQVRDFVKPLIKKDVLLLEIAEKIENKIVELGGKPAFPTNLSIDNIAAHYTPSHNDETKAHGLLKVDFGVSVDGWISDTAFSIDLENSEENKKLIQASELALENAIKVFNNNSELDKVGKVISDAIESFGFSPIVNLGGHGLDEYDVHSSPFIPNIPDRTNEIIEKGLYAIEPFATTGEGRVHDGNPSGIYQLVEEKNVRSLTAREVLNFIIEEYSTLPFCSRWLVKKFGARALFALRQLEDNGNLHHFAQLVENKNAKVAQSEHTIFINENGEKVVTTS